MQHVYALYVHKSYTHTIHCICDYTLHYIHYCIAMYIQYYIHQPMHCIPYLLVTQVKHTLLYVELVLVRNSRNVTYVVTFQCSLCVDHGFGQGCEGP